MTYRKMFRVIFISVIFLGLTASFAGAALIPGLHFEHYPRVRAIDVTVEYDATNAGGTAGTGLLHAQGYTWEYYEENGSTFIGIDGFFTLDVEINKTTLLIDTIT